MDHDVRDLRIEAVDDDAHVVVCKCGWRTAPSRDLKAAVVQWQAHRSQF